MLELLVQHSCVRVEIYSARVLSSFWVGRVAYKRWAVAPHEGFSPPEVYMFGLVVWTLAFLSFCCVEEAAGSAEDQHGVCPYMVVFRDEGFVLENSDDCDHDKYQWGAEQSEKKLLVL